MSSTATVNVRSISLLVFWKESNQFILLYFKHLFFLIFETQFSYLIENGIPESIKQSSQHLARFIGNLLREDLCLIHLQSHFARTKFRVKDVNSQNAHQMPVLSFKKQAIVSFYVQFKPILTTVSRLYGILEQRFQEILMAS